METPSKDENIYYRGAGAYVCGEAFFEQESCGKCTPCLAGTREARPVLDRFVAGTGTAQDLERLSELARLLQTMSLGGLGISAANPIRSALTHFRDEFGSA